MGLLGFPDPVNETSARVVAGGVVTMAASAVVLDRPWVLAPLTYGFAARVLTGPKLSPLGQIATRVVTPRIKRPAKFSPGAPKRLAQGMGLGMSGTALVLHYGFGRKRAAYTVLTGLIGAASLEAFFGICLACKMFPVLVKLGVVHESTCEDCADVTTRLNVTAGTVGTAVASGAREPDGLAQAV
jgi:hypothetical protein